MEIECREKVKIPLLFIFVARGILTDTEFKGEHLYIDIISNKHRTKEKVIQRKNKTMTKYNDIL